MTTSRKLRLPAVGRRFGRRPTLGFLDDRVVARAMRRFAIGSVIALTVLVLAIYLVGRSVAREQALEEAEDRAERLSHTVGGLVTDAVRRREPGSLDPLQAVLRTRFQEGYLWRVKIWSPDGTILWSDRDELVGQRFPLPERVEALLGTTAAHAELSELEDPENASERAAGEMLEVYAGSYDAEGRPVLVELYVSTDEMKSEERAILTAFIPLGVAGLVLFQAAVLPLAVVLGRRVQRSEEMRAKLTAQALRASELERKRIAQELHDGVVQDLTGVGISLPGVRRSLLRGEGGERAAATVTQLEEIVQRTISVLRSMMIEVYPPDLEKSGLVGAIIELERADRFRGLDVSIEVVGRLDLHPDCVRLLYRVVREGLHNVVKHARADHATVTLEQRPETVVARVCDDGTGIQAASQSRKESLGLRILTEAVEQAGGGLTLRNRDDAEVARGACLEVVLPLPEPRRKAAQGFSKGLGRWWSESFSRGARTPGGQGAGDDAVRS